MQDTGKNRNTKDQFYTKSSVSKLCVDTIISNIPDAYKFKWVEPSAGNGSFLDNVPPEFDKQGIDIDPKSNNITQADFMEWEYDSEKPCILFGNPPFGRQSSLAKQFIKRGCEFADVIAFILPRSFLKPSMTIAFNMLFHCKTTIELDKDSFELNGVAYDVPCVFQIWVKQDTPRILESKVEPIGFKYVKENYDIAFRRVGGLAGKCYLPGQLNPQCYYFWKLDQEFIPFIPEIIKKMNEHVFPSNTVGPRSLSKSEANKVMNQILKNLS